MKDILKQALGAVLVLAIAFGIVRPMLRGVISGNPTLTGEYVGRVPHGGGQMAAVQSAAGGPATLALPSYDEKVAAAKNITGHDPARVAQVVKKWVSADE